MLLVERLPKKTVNIDTHNFNYKSRKESKSYALYSLRYVLGMRVVAHIHLLIFGYYFVVVLSLPVFDIFVGQNLVGQVVVGNDLHHDPPKNKDHPQPLHQNQVMPVPKHIDHNSHALSGVNDQGKDVLPENTHKFVAEDPSESMQNSPNW